MRLEVLDEVIERIVDRTRVVLGPRQAIEVGQHLGAAGIEVVIELPPAAELAQVQSDAPPAHKTGLVDNRLGIAAIG